MLILYAISVLSFFVLLWAAFAIARHIRRASATQTVDPSTLIEAEPEPAAESRAS